MCELDPYAGAAMAVAEVCRNLACTGAEPIGITDCLNFGNPERPEVMDQLARAIDGLAAACRALDVPIVSGNVSLYNETDGRSILPTPTVAAVGLLRGGEDVVTVPFKQEGDAVLLLGQAACKGAVALAGSEWLVRTMSKPQAHRSPEASGAPVLDLDAEVSLQRLVLDLARAHWLASAHDVSDGGLAVALAECCTVGLDDVGARIVLPMEGSPLDAVAALFGEAPSRVVVSVRPELADRVIERARGFSVPAARIGRTGGTRLDIGVAPLGSFSIAVAELRDRRDACLRNLVDA